MTIITEDVCLGCEHANFCDRYDRNDCESWAMARQTIRKLQQEILELQDIISSPSPTPAPALGVQRQADTAQTICSHALAGHEIATHHRRIPLNEGPIKKGGLRSEPATSRPNITLATTAPALREAVGYRKRVWFDGSTSWFLTLDNKIIGGEYLSEADAVNGVEQLKAALERRK